MSVCLQLEKASYFVGKGGHSCLGGGASLKSKGCFFPTPSKNTSLVETNPADVYASPSPLVLMSLDLDASSSGKCSVGCIPAYQQLLLSYLSFRGLLSRMFDH